MRKKTTKVKTSSKVKSSDSEKIKVSSLIKAKPKAIFFGASKNKKAKS